MQHNERRQPVIIAASYRKRVTLRSGSSSVGSRRWWARPTHVITTVAALSVLGLAVESTLSAPSEDPVGQSKATAAPAGGSVLPPTPAHTSRQCLFLPRTLFPQLAMGVRRLDDPPEQRDRRLLDLWADPGSGGPPSSPLRRLPLYRPLFVYERRTIGEVTWYLLGGAYAGNPLGWADGRHLYPVASRYAYHFSNLDRVPPGVHLYESRAQAYEALESQSQVPPVAPLDGVVVSERLVEDRWSPLAIDAIPPFVELSEEGDPTRDHAAGLMDTTLTFPMPRENRLIHLGAVAGGPVDAEELARKGREAHERAGIAIVFVIDETFSMQPFFGGVADFIDKNLDLDRAAVDVRVAVSWYSDVENTDDTPHDVRQLEPLNGPGREQDLFGENRGRIVKSVREHKERIIGGQGAQERELVYRGLIAAIEGAGFKEGENAMVFVIGDAADRSSPEALGSLQKKLTDLIQKHALQLGFVQVGKLGPAFADQARAFRDALPLGQRDAIFVQGAGDAPLQKRIADLQAQMESRRARLLSEIDEMKTRNRYSEPGPALLARMLAAGVDRASFDRDHLQFFAPAWGWLYHPQQPDATPQLRQVVFLTKPESDALLPAITLAIKGLEDRGRIDADVARAAFVEALGRRSGHTAVEAAAEVAWQSLPADDRTLGRFLHDAMGLRVRNAILFHRGTANPRTSATQLAIQSLRESRDRISMARDPEVTWVDAWKVCP